MYHINVTEGLLQAFNEIQQPRSPYQIEKFVIGQHATIEMQYFQCVLEMQIKYNNIRRSIIRRQIIEDDIQKLEEKGDKKSLLNAELKRIDLEEMDGAMLGAIREFETFKRLWDKFPIKYTREQLDFNQNEYWHRRLISEANLELQSHGTIGKGMLEALSQIGYLSKPDFDKLLIQRDESKCISNS